MEQKTKRFTLKEIKAKIYEKTKASLTDDQVEILIRESVLYILSEGDKGVIITLPVAKRGKIDYYFLPIKDPEVIKKQKEGFKKLECFIGHNFNKQKINNFRPAINQILVFFNIKPYYADKELKSGHILKDKIFPKIKLSDLSIFDITKLKASVAIETGGALIMERPVILLLKRGEKPPSDLEGLDRIEYKSNLDLCENLFDMLPGFLKEHKLL